MSDGKTLTSYRLLSVDSIACAYAYSPRENTGSHGKYHLVTLLPLERGRLRRAANSPLCGKRFWGLDRGGRTFEQFLSYPCPKCLENAVKLGVVADDRLANTLKVLLNA